MYLDIAYFYVIDVFFGDFGHSPPPLPLCRDKHSRGYDWSVRDRYGLAKPSILE